MSLETTVIGSFPRVGDSPDRMMYNAVRKQIEAGVKLVTDGQVRHPVFTDYVAREIGGFERYEIENAETKEKKGKWRIARKIDGRLPVSSFEMRSDFTYLQGLCDQLDGNAKPIFTMAGPLTMAFITEAEIAGYGKKPYREPQLYRDIAEAELRLVENVCPDGVAAAIHIDEPFLSQSPGALKYAREGIEYLALNLHAHTETVNLHVCGNVTVPSAPNDSAPVFEKFLDLKGIDVLSHGFMGVQEKPNQNLLTKYKVADYGKRLGVGCVDSGSEDVESVEAIETILGVAHRTQDGRIVVHPDCGLKGLDELQNPQVPPIEIAFMKLKNMCAAAASFD